MRYKIKKKTLMKLTKCYSVMCMDMEDGVHLFFASEQKNIGCYEFYGTDFQHCREVWKEPGGCMSMIPIPNKPNEFLAIQDFCLQERNNKAHLVWNKLIHGVWQAKTILTLPYLHRFDIFKCDSDLHIVASTIAQQKKNKEDWTTPGAVYTGILPNDWNTPLQLQPLIDNCYKNHGYWRGNHSGYIACDKGIAAIVPPHDGTSWSYHWLSDKPVSDIAFLKNSFITVEPFHGDIITVYSYLNGQIAPLQVWNEDMKFGHALYAGSLCKKDVFIAGIRESAQELFILTKNHDKYEKQLIDHHTGPANIALRSFSDYDLLLSANRTAHEAAIYYIQSEVEEETS